MNAYVNYTNQNYSFAVIVIHKMKIKSLLLFGIVLLVAESIHAQVKIDTVPAFLADSIKTVYIYADTGTALNRTDKNGKKQGLWEKRYPDGHLRYRGHFIDDRPYGIFKNYYDNPDSLQSVRTFSEDGLSAYAHLFYTTGALEAEGKFINQKEDSIWKFYDDMQRLLRKDQYKNGKKEGKSLIFYATGNILEVKNFKNDLEEGPFQIYYSEGSIKQEGTYGHGMLQDTLYAYETDGKMAVKGNYLNDLHEGDWIYYYDGAPKDTLIYHKGKCLNCEKFMPNKKQEDSLKIHYQKLQQQLDHPSDNLDDESKQPGDGEE